MSTIATKQDLLDLIKRGSAGDVEAQNLLVKIFTPVLRYHVRKHLHQPLRRLMDSLDVVQDAWQEVWEEAARGRLWESSEALCAFLVKVAEVKAMEANRHWGRAKRRGDLEAASLDDPEAGEPAARAPGPAEVAGAHDELEWLFRHTPERVHEMLRLREEGYTHEQIAQQLGLHERTVRKALEALRHLYEGRQHRAGR